MDHPVFDSVCSMQRSEVNTGRRGRSSNPSPRQYQNTYWGFLEPDDKTLNGKSFAVWRGMAYENTANDDDHEAVAKETKSANDNPE